MLHCEAAGELNDGVPELSKSLTAIVERDGNGYVASCPEMDVASQGDTAAEARGNLAEALTLYFECASAEEIDVQLRGEVYVARIEVPVV